MRTWTIVMLVCCFAAHLPCLGQDLSRDDLWEILRHQNELADKVTQLIPLDEYDASVEIVGDYYDALLAGKQPFAERPKIREALADYAIATTIHLQASLPQPYEELQLAVLPAIKEDPAELWSDFRNDLLKAGHAFEMLIIGMWFVAAEESADLAAMSDSLLRLWIVLHSLDPDPAVTYPASKGYHALQLFLSMHVAQNALSLPECADVAKVLRNLQRTNYFSFIRWRTTYIRAYQEDPGKMPGAGIMQDLEMWREIFPDLFAKTFRLSRSEFDAERLQADPEYVEVSKDVPETFEWHAEWAVTICTLEGRAVSLAARFQMLLDLMLLMRSYEATHGSLPNQELVESLAAGLGAEDLKVVPRDDGYIFGWGEGLDEATTDLLLINASRFLADRDDPPYVGIWIR